MRCSRLRPVPRVTVVTARSACVAGALLSLSADRPETQKACADTGAIKPLVALLSEENDYARKKAAGAIAACVLMLQRSRSAEVAAHA